MVCDLWAILRGRFDTGGSAHHVTGSPHGKVSVLVTVEIYQKVSKQDSLV